MIKCPQCGKVFNRHFGQVPYHMDIVGVCEGSWQVPQNAYSDKRPLWSEEDEEKDSNNKKDQ